MLEKPFDKPASAPVQTDNSTRVAQLVRSELAGMLERLEGLGVSREDALSQLYGQAMSEAYAIEGLRREQAFQAEIASYRRLDEAQLLRTAQECMREFGREAEHAAVSQEWLRRRFDVELGGSILVNKAQWLWVLRDITQVELIWTVSRALPDFKVRLFGTSQGPNSSSPKEYMLTCEPEELCKLDQPAAPEEGESAAKPQA